MSGEKGGAATVAPIEGGMHTVATGTVTYVVYAQCCYLLIAKRMRSCTSGAEVACFQKRSVPYRYFPFYNLPVFPLVRSIFNLILKYNAKEKN